MNILLLGLGSIAQKHLRALKELKVPGKVFALRSQREPPHPFPLPAGEGQGEGRPDVISVYDVSDVPSDVAFAMICTPTYVHARSIETALTFRCPLFIEKPLLRHLSEIDQVMKSIDEVRVPTYVACHLRHHPCLHYVWDHLKDHRVRNVRAYCGSYMPKWVPGDFRKSFRANKEQSGGVHLELIHELDYVTWLFGMPMESSSTLKNTGALGIDITDDARYDLTYDGFHATVEVNYHLKNPRRTLEMTFDEGAWTVDLLTFAITDEKGSTVFHSDWSIADIYREQMRYFLECLKAREQPMNSVKEAAEVLCLALR